MKPERQKIMHEAKKINVVIEIQVSAANNYDPDFIHLARFDFQVPVIDGEHFIPSVEWTLKEIINKMVVNVIDGDPEISAEKDASIAKGETAVMVGGE